MAKKRRHKSSKLVKKYLGDLAENPATLGKFILNPCSVLKSKKVPESLWTDIFRAVAREVMADFVHVAVFYQQ